METWLSSALARTVITYFVQATLGLILFFIFRYFFRIYKHKFLNTWAISWLSFSVFMISTAAITGMGINQLNGFSRISLTIISMISSYTQAAFILVGSLELIRSKATSRKHLLDYGWNNCVCICNYGSAEVCRSGRKNFSVCGTGGA